MKIFSSPRSLGKILAALSGLGVVSTALAAPPPLPQIPGYRAVQLDLRTINHLEATVFVNGKPEHFGIDTGASTTVMNAHDAGKDGVKPTDTQSPYGQYEYVKGQTLRIALVDNMRAGAMDFGSGPIALYSEARSDPRFIELAQATRRMSGLLGADVLLHYKAIINCRNRQIFFPVAGHRESKLAAVVTGMGFVRVPLREESGRALSVPCTIGDKEGRLLVDTGAFTTFLDGTFVSELRIPTQPTSMNFVDFAGHRTQAAVARVTNLQIGPYRLPAQKIFVLANSTSADYSKHTQARIVGVFGADLLAAQRGIIDLESMSLFLK